MQHDTLALPSMNSWIPEDLNTAITAAGGLATTVIAFLVGRKNIARSATDNDGAELDNVVKAIGIWQDTATRLNEKVHLLETQHEVVQDRLDTLRKQHEDCEESKVKLSEKVSCLETDICDLKGRLDLP